jgi:hypothetical protein
MAELDEGLARGNESVWFERSFRLGASRLAASRAFRSRPSLLLGRTYPWADLEARRYTLRVPTLVLDIARERELDGTETSSERFDRVAFAARAVSLVKPHNMCVAIGRGRSRVVVESGRAWGSGEDARWAMLSVPPMASRRAIAAAVATLTGPAPAPYALSVLLAEVGGAAAE